MIIVIIINTLNKIMYNLQIIFVKNLKENLTSIEVVSGNSFLL